MSVLPLAHAVKEKIRCRVSQTTLSNQEKQFHKEAVLSALEHTESRIPMFNGNGKAGKAT